MWACQAESHCLTLSCQIIQRKERSQHNLLLSILGICCTPWKNSETSWVLVADNIIFNMTLKGNLVIWWTCRIHWYQSNKIPYHHYFHTVVMYHTMYFTICFYWHAELFFFKRLMFGCEELLSQGLLRTISSKWQLNCRKCPASRSFIIAVRTFRSNLYAVLVTHDYLPFNLFHFYDPCRSFNYHSMEGC